jgi:hypothetical protein
VVYRPRSTRPVDIRPVIDPKDQDPPTFLIELVDDAIWTTSRHHEPSQLSSQLVSDTDRVAPEGTNEELDDRRGGLLR